jgi:hypothetical protein
MGTGFALPQGGAFDSDRLIATRHLRVPGAFLLVAYQIRRPEACNRCGTIRRNQTHTGSTRGGVA